MRHTHSGSDRFSLAVKNARRAPTRCATDFHILPAHAVVPAGAKRFHGRFFGGETRGISLSTVRFRLAVVHLSFGEYAVQKALPVTLNRIGNPRNFSNVDASAYDHG